MTYYVLTQEFMVDVVGVLPQPGDQVRLELIQDVATVAINGVEMWRGYASEVPSYESNSLSMVW